VVGLKKGGRHRIPSSSKREKRTIFGSLNLRSGRFYWKQSEQSDSGVFCGFLTQLRQRFPGKQLVIILDNASIHKSKKVRDYLKRWLDIHLFYLPSYLPEYNPVELIWK